MAKLNASQITAFAINAGIPDAQVQTSVAIAFAESGGDINIVSPKNKNGSRDYGLWQVNSVHKAWFDLSRYADAAYNADAMYRIWNEAGKKWTPWTTFKSGAYKKYLTAAKNISKNDLELTTEQNISSGKAIAAFTKDGTSSDDNTMLWVGGGVVGLVIILAMANQ
jgi:hypothetical protein